MKLHNKIYVSTGYAQNLLENLSDRITELTHQDNEEGTKEFKIMHKHIRALFNQEERVVNKLNKIKEEKEKLELVLDKCIREDIKRFIKGEVVK